MTLRGNYCFAELGYSCLPALELPFGAGVQPCFTAWGGGTCSHVVRGGADTAFLSQGRLGVADRPFLPFSVGPLQREGCLFFFVSLASSASLFELFFRVRFVRVRQCGCAHSSADGEQHPALGQGDGNVLFGSVWREPFSSCCYLFFLSFSLN